MTRPAAWEDDYGHAYIGGTHDPAEAAKTWGDSDDPEDWPITAEQWGNAEKYWVDPAALDRFDDEVLPPEVISDTERPGWVPHLRWLA